jgi:hypothetical protein
MKKYAMALVINLDELATQGRRDFTLAKQRATLPVGRKAIPKSALEMPAITAERTFLSKDRHTELVARVTPYRSEQYAIASVLNSDAMIMLNPTKKIDILEKRNVENVRIDGLHTVYAHEEILRIGDVTQRIRLIVSSVGQALFSIHVTSQDEFWSWSEIAAIATVQAEKIQKNAETLLRFF